MQIKYYKAYILIIIIILLLIFSISNYIENDNLFNKIIKNNISKENIIKLNSYNIYINNILDFFNSNKFFLINTNNNTNKYLDVFF